MSTAKTILGLAPLVQSAYLLDSNVRFYKKKKKKTKDFISQGVGNIFGATMIKAESEMIGGMD